MDNISHGHTIPRKVIKAIYNIIADIEVRTLDDFYQKVYDIPEVFIKIITKSISDQEPKYSRNKETNYTIGIIDNVSIGIPGTCKDISKSINIDTDYHINITHVTTRQLFTPTQKKLRDNFEESFLEYKNKFTTNLSINKPIVIDNPVYRFCDKYNSQVCQDISSKILQSCMFYLLNNYDKKQFNSGSPNQIYEYVTTVVNNTKNKNDMNIEELDKKIKNFKSIHAYIIKNIENKNKYIKIKDKIGYCPKITKSMLKQRCLPDLMKKILKLEKDRDQYVYENIVMYKIMDNYDIYKSEFEELFQNQNDIERWIAERMEYSSQLNVYMQKIDTIAKDVRRYGIIVNSITICDPNRSNYIIQVTRA